MNKIIFRPTVFDCMWKILIVTGLGFSLFPFLYLIWETIIQIINLKFNNDNIVLIGEMILLIFALVIISCIISYFLISKIKGLYYFITSTYILLKGDDIIFKVTDIFTWLKSSELNKSISLKTISKISAFKYNVLGYRTYRTTKHKVTIERWLKIEMFNKNWKLLLDVDSWLFFWTWQLKNLFKYLKWNYLQISFEWYRFWAKNFNEWSRVTSTQI